MNLTACSALALALLTSASTHAAGPLPEDVARYIERREACDHWRGEEAYDAEREAEILRGICQSCPGSDAGLARLKKKHGADKAVQKRLAEFEPNIELRDDKEFREICRNSSQEDPKATSRPRQINK